MKQFINKKQAQEISKIVGRHYSHHDENQKYEDDTNKQCYFYEGMSPYTFKLDMVTGLIELDFLSNMILSIQSEKDINILLEIYEKSEDNIKKLETLLKKHHDFKEIQSLVKNYLKIENIL